MNSIQLKRIEQGLKQKDVAKILEIKQSTVSMWETGQSKPRADTLMKLSKILDCKVEELLEEQENQTNGLKEQKRSKES